VSRHLGNLFVDHRGKVELAAVVAAAGAFLLATCAENFDETMSRELRGALYGSLAGTSGALLGFVLAALAILVALPSTERMEALRQHPSWERVPASYVRAAASLLTALILCTLGIVLDSGSDAWVPYEAVVAGVLGLALAHVTIAVAALDLILGVARERTPLQPKAIKDPGP
jgi:hypothetical protein